MGVVDSGVQNGYLDALTRVSGHPTGTLPHLRGADHRDTVGVVAAMDGGGTDGLDLGQGLERLQFTAVDAHAHAVEG